MVYCLKPFDRGSMTPSLTGVNGLDTLGEVDREHAKAIKRYPLSRRVFVVLDFLSAVRAGGPSSQVDRPESTASACPIRGQAWQGRPAESTAAARSSRG